MLNDKIEKENRCKRKGKKSFSIRDNISYSWLGSWYRDHHTKKHHEAQSLINPVLNDEIKKKRKVLLKKETIEKKREIKRIRTKSNI
jgi:hypothetical protein